MKKILTLALLVLAVGATSARAQGGLNLNWDSCISDAAVVDKVFACNSNTGAAFGFYASLQLPTALTAFAASSAIIDIGFANALPAWWQTATGECRAGSVSFSADPNVITNNGASACPDIWGGSAQVLSVFQPQANIHGANGLRLNGGAAIPAGTEFPLAADGTEYLVGKVTINRAKTTSTGACAGCTDGACIVLNECWVQQPNPNPSFRITNEQTRRYITWQGGGGVDCQTVPTQNRTWGAIKNMYR